MRLYTSSLVTIFYVLTAIAQNPPDHDADALIDSINTLFASKDYLKGTTLGSRALQLYEQAGDSLKMSRALLLIARGNAFQGELKQAIPYASRSALISKNLGEPETEYLANNILSWAYWELGVDAETKNRHQQRQLEVVELLGKDEHKALVYNNYGYDATVNGSIPLEKAMEYMNFANSYYAEAEGHQGRWYTLMNLTWLYRLSNNLAMSEHYGELAVKQALKDEDRHAVIEAATNLGETYMVSGQWEKASGYFELAKKWSEKDTDRDSYVFDIYYAHFLAKSQPDMAERLLEDAISKLHGLEEFYEMLGRAYLAELYAERGKTELAKAQLAHFSDRILTNTSFEAIFLAGLTRLKMEDATDADRENFRKLKERAAAIGAKYLLEQARSK